MLTKRRHDEPQLTLSLNSIAWSRRFLPRSFYFLSLSVIVLLSINIFLSRLNNETDFDDLQTALCDEQCQQFKLKLFNISVPTLCVIVRVYDRQLQDLPVLALSLYRSGIQPIRLFIVNTDIRTNLETLNQTIFHIQQFTGNHEFITWLSFSRIPYLNQYGYGVTDQALEYLYQQYDRNSSTCHYLLVTNGDNIYSHNLGKHIIPHMKMNVDMISWAFTSHHKREYRKIKTHKNKQRNPRTLDDGTEKCNPAILRLGEIDLGATVYRFSLLHKHKFYYKGTHGYRIDSDGRFLEKVLPFANDSVVLGQTLFMHQ